MGFAASGTAIDPRSIVSRISRLRSSPGQADPYPIYAELRDMGDVVPAPWGALLLTRYEVCDQVLRSRSWAALDSEWRIRQGEGNRWSVPSSQELGKCLQALNPPEHTRQRRSLGNVFDRGTLAALRHPVSRVVEERLDVLAARMRDGEADFAALVSEEVTVGAVGHWLSLPRADYPLLLSLAHDQAYAQELLPSPSQLAVADAATSGLHKYFHALVAERRAAPGDDIVSSWLRTWDELEPDREAADEAVYRLTMFLVIAALETTSTLLSSMIWHLDQHPEQRSWLRGRPEDVPNAIEEVLRYDPPVHITTRAAAHDTELGGHQVKRDQLVHIMVASANHDPARTANPGTLDVRRGGTHLSHLAFGGGIHYCLGAGLARLEAATLLTAVLRRFPTLRVSRPPVWEPRAAFRRLTALHVVDH